MYDVPSHFGELKKKKESYRNIVKVYKTTLPSTNFNVNNP